MLWGIHRTGVPAWHRPQVGSEMAPALKPLAPAASADLRWIRTQEPQGCCYHLQAGGDRVARLCFRDPLDWSATGESASGSWLFVEEGLLRPYVVVRSLSDDRTVAACRSGLLGRSGRLELADGRYFCWRRGRFRAWECCVENAQGAALMAVEAECQRSWLSGPRLMGGRVRITPGAVALPELMLLVLLSWYLLVLPEYRAGCRCPP